MKVGFLWAARGIVGLKEFWEHSGLKLNNILSVHSTRRRNDNHYVLAVEDDNGQTRLQGNLSKS